MCLTFTNLNYKIERQLQMLNELWSDRINITWDGITQEKYYNIKYSKLQAFSK